MCQMIISGVLSGLDNAVVASIPGNTTLQSQLNRDYDDARRKCIYCTFSLYNVIESVIFRYIQYIVYTYPLPSFHPEQPSNNYLI